MKEKSIKELVSIIVTAYQAEDSIQRCIDSILRQSYCNIEIIVINDGSTDKTDNIVIKLAEQDARIKYQYIKNGGVSNARNVGIELSSGEYIAFMDCDDIMDKNFVMRMLCQIRCEEGDICVCAYKRILENKESIIRAPVGVYKIKSDKAKLLELFLNKMFSPVWNKLYKRNIIQKFDINYISGEDTLFNLSCISVAEKIVIIDVPLYTYISSRKNNIKSHYKRVRYETFLPMYERILFYFEDTDENMKYRLKKIFIDELQGCYLTVFKENKSCISKVLFEYHIINKNETVQAAARFLADRCSKNIWPYLIKNNMCYTIMFFQIVKYIRNCWILFW